MMINIMKLMFRKAAVRSCSSRIGVLKNFTLFTGKYLCWSLFLIKLQA